MDNNLSQMNKNDDGTINVNTKDADFAIKKYAGAIIIALFVILGLILGGFYYWYSISTKPVVIDFSTTRPTRETNKEPETTTASAQVDSLTVLSTSDELSAIEADLLSTDLDNLETEINQIEAELDSDN